MMLKKDLRNSFLQARVNMPPARYSSACSSITGHAISWLRKRGLPPRVHIFLPMLNRHEFDTWPLIHFFWEQQVEVYTSISNLRLASMQSVLLTPETEIITGKSGIPQPATGVIKEIDDFDIVFIPLLAVDVAGYRVGYGKGMYDRFLKGKTALRVGVSFFAPVAAITDKDHYDIPLNCCVTPAGVIRF